MNKLSVVPRILSLPGGSLVNETFRNNSDCIMKPIRISGSPPGWEVDEKVRHFVVGQEKQNSKNGCSWQFIIILLQLFDSFYSIQLFSTQIWYCQFLHDFGYSRIVFGCSSIVWTTFSDALTVFVCFDTVFRILRYPFRQLW